MKYKAFFYVRWPFNISFAILNTVVLQGNRLFTMDTRAVNHILTHSGNYQKLSQVVRLIPDCWQGWVISISSRSFRLHTLTEDCRRPFHRRCLASPASSFSIRMIKPTFRTRHLVQHRVGRSSSQTLSKYGSLIPFHADHSP
jgi:hypothetical protein